jgi:NAD(P)H-flavin reductase
MDEDLVPRSASVVGIEQETADTRTLRLELGGTGGGGLQFVPGQFCLISVMGTGEAVFCLASPPARTDSIEVTVKDVGKVTSAIHQLEIGDPVGFRGPYGRGFPVDAMSGRNLVFAGGGIGLAPLRPLIWHVLSERDSYRDIRIVYGARSPGDLVYRADLAKWAGRDDLRLVTAVDPGGEEPGWEGEVGLVPQVLERISPPSDAVLVTCGPPVMLRFVFATALKLGFNPADVVTTLEMKMKCGVGTCGRCNVGRRYVCRDGPVFTMEELRELPDEF